MQSGIKFSEDIIPISDLKVNPGRIINQVEKTHRPVLVTSRGRGVAIVESLKDYEAKGMMATGVNPQQNLVEIVELRDHPYFIGVQFHPELKSTVENPHPLFVSFVKAAMDFKEKGPKN